MDNPLLRGVCRVKRSAPLCGSVRVPGDKSISHRAVMLASLAQGDSTIKGFLESEDCVATLKAFERMGAAWERRGGDLIVQGRGAQGLREPDDVLDMGNSGTGTRLLLGVVTGQDFAATLTGDSSLRSRPMKRVIEPLSLMGARFLGRENGGKLPLTVCGGALKGIHYRTPVASAQLKSAVLLAGLFAEGETCVEEPGPSRDHTERMLRTFGVNVHTEGLTHTLQGGPQLHSREITVPGDISSAAFFLTAAAIVPGSDLLIESVGVNPTRTGILDVLREMGANITLENERSCGAEPIADIRIRYAPLRGVRIGGDLVVRMIDEFPIFAVLAASAATPSIVEGAEELRVKESDRIAAIVEELNRMGASLSERPDGFAAAGGAKFRGAECGSRGDHRIAMSLAVAGLASSGETVVHGTAPIATSFPDFFALCQCLSPGSVENEP